MAQIDGGIGFSAEYLGAGTAFTVPYQKAANNTTPIRAGHAVVRVGNSRLVQRAAVTSGFISSAKIEGFACTDDASAANNYLPSTYAIMPAITRPGGLEEILVHPAIAVFRFRLAVKTGQAAGKAHVGKYVSIGVGANGEHFLDTSDTTTNPLATIVDFPENQEGVDGGTMYFIIQAVDSSYVTPT